MTKSAMNNELRVKDVMTVTEVKAGAKAAGYKFKHYTQCPVCIDELEMAMQAVGYTGTYPIWANTTTAMVFDHKTRNKLVACPCGYRGTVAKKEYIPKPSCKNYGQEINGNVCKATIGKMEIEENDGYCWNCRPKGTEETTTEASKEPAQKAIM